MFLSCKKEFLFKGMFSFSYHEEFLQVKEADVLCGLFKALIHEEFPQVEEAEVLCCFGNSGGTVSLKFRM